MISPSDSTHIKAATANWPAGLYFAQENSLNGWLYIINDVLIWAAYLTLSGLIFYIIKKRTDLPFLKRIGLFVLFMILSGLTYLFDAINIFYPVYNINEFIRLFTAIISLITVFVIIKNIRLLLHLKGPAELENIVTERTNELRNSEQHFRTLMDNIPDRIALIDREYKYRFLNRAILTSNAKGKMGDSILQLGYSKTFMDSYLSVLDSVFSTGNAATYEVEYPSPDNKNTFLIINIIPMFEDGKITHVMTITKDITKLKENIALKATNQELIKLSNKLKNQKEQLENFADIAAHNLRGPASNIIGLLDLFENADNLSDNKPYQHYVRDVANGMLLTVDSLYQSLKVIQDSEGSNMSTIKLNQVFNNTLKKYEQKIEFTGAVVNTHFENCPEIVFPRGYLESIFEHLLANSLKYRRTDVQTGITFSSELQNDYILLTCVDNGIGIDLSNFGKNLFKLQKTLTEQGKIRGVGLFIIKSIVDILEGKIEIEGASGKGTIVKMWFPTNNRKEKI